MSSPEQAKIEAEHRELEALRSRLRARDLVLCQEDIRRSNDRVVTFGIAVVAEFDAKAAAAILLADGNIDWPPSTAPTHAIQLERRAIAIALDTIGEKLGALKVRHNAIELEHLGGEPRALLHERALLICRLQGANVRWQRFVEERSRAGGLSASYLARIWPTTGLLGTGAEQGAAQEYLNLLVKLNIITAAEVVEARGVEGNG